MEKGINVFVEKPLSFSTKECEEMIELTKKKKVVLTSGYIERFTMKKKLGFRDRSVVNLLAEFGHSTQDGLGSMMEFPQARSDHMPEVLLGLAGDNP